MEITLETEDEIAPGRALAMKCDPHNHSYHIRLGISTHRVDICTHRVDISTHQVDIYAISTISTLGHKIFMSETLTAPLLIVHLAAAQRSSSRI